MRKKLATGILVALVTALAGVEGADAATQWGTPSWSIVAHFEYVDGFNYDYTVARNVPTSEMPKYLRDCGSSHWTGSVVRYYCYPVAE